jgi:hypothetical protein
MADKPDLTPDQALTFSDTLFDKILACAETVRDLDERITRLNQRINKIRTSKEGAAFTKAIITILADEDSHVQLRLIYREDNGAELKNPLLISYAQVCSTLVGRLSTTYTQLQKTENRLHPSLFTTASISRKTRGRTGPARS